MSGILGLFHLDGDEIHRRDLAPMASFLEKRGPEGTHLWAHGPVGLGHTRLSTTPEALKEFLPLVHEPSGCAITADLRLDNRSELLSALGMRATDPDTGDAGLVLHAYLRWGIRCVERLLGDFAFAIWDPRRHQLFCARDHLGMKPFNYHHRPGKLFAFASSPVAVVAYEGVPYAINMARVADALVPELEGVDTTSTFFEDVFRLPPAHALLVSPEGLRLWRYWTLDPDVELYRDEEETIEAFLDAFTKAVDARLRTIGPRVSMLSGGMDSNSIVAVAKELLAKRGEPQLMTISAISNDPSCVESNAIRTVIGQGGIDAHTVAVEELDELMPQLVELTATQEEPFDHLMTMLSAMWLKGRSLGAVSVLDGGNGDVVLTEGAVLERMLRSAQPLTAMRTARQFERYWRIPGYGRSALLSAMARTTAPTHLRLRVRPHLVRRRASRRVSESPLTDDFAASIGVSDRLVCLYEQSPGPQIRSSSAAQRAASISHPYMVTAQERYERTAAAVGVEPRDPFADLRVIGVALAIPDRLLIRGGWPKALLRHAIGGLVPDTVRWRIGKEHVGWAFNQRRILAELHASDRRYEAPWTVLDGVTRPGRFPAVAGSEVDLEEADLLASVATWLARCNIHSSGLPSKRAEVNDGQLDP